MISITDPSELKPADVYRQARLVAAKTSRGSDRNWYRDAFDLPSQWHLWFDGGREVVSATFCRLDNRWRPGPEIQLANLTTSEGAGDLLGELLSLRFFSQVPKSLGVILHVADEFALAGLKQAPEASAEGGEDLEIVRFNLIDDPRESLADREVSVDTTSWRLLPFWGASPGQPHGTAIALSRSREAFLSKLLTHGEELRVPIRVAVTVAPVESLAALPLLDPKLEGGRLVVIPYLKYTVVFAIAPSGELRSARSLGHRGGAVIPAGLTDILWSMAVSAELAGIGADGLRPNVLVVSGDPAVLQAATRALDGAGAGRQAIHVETLDLSNHPLMTAIPGQRPEFLVHDASQVESATAGACLLAATQTFQALWKNWIRQSNFFDTAKLDALYPSIQDLRLLRLSSVLTMLLAAAFIGLGGYGGYSLFKATSHPSWNLTPLQLKRTEAAQAKLLLEKRQIEITNRLLMPRSRGWTTLEFLMQMFPEDSGVRLDSFDYGMEASRAGVSAVKGKPAESVGMTRTWSVKGLAKPQAMELLSTLNSQRGLSALFDRMAKATADASYAPDPSRQVTVTLTQGRNPRFAADAATSTSPAAQDPSSTFPFRFEATITQALSDKDALALPTEKPF